MEEKACEKVKTGFVKKQLMNPYLPSWEYVPDGEPYVFDGRVYVFGSHDRAGGDRFCLNDYVCWSAPETNLADWKYEGIIYRKIDDPANEDGEMCLFAPDVTKGPDGRYYLYYVLNGLNIVSVAVCDSPAGRYEFYGYVHDRKGNRLGERASDEEQFDPGVMTEGERTYLYTGFCPGDDQRKQGAMLTVLGRDMLTIEEEPVPVVPSTAESSGSGFEGHEFFEASSIRKRGDLYYFIYSSVLSHELCYAIGKSPKGSFKYRGVIVSNNDSYIDTYKPADKPMYYGSNNHGSIVEINGEWYIFYHRHTNGTCFSRQGCLEKIKFSENGMIIQAEMTSCGGSEPLEGYGEYPAYIACNLYCDTERGMIPFPGWMDDRFPKITQDGDDGQETIGYIANMRDGATAGFKYFAVKSVNRISVTVRGYAQGYFEVKHAWDGHVLGTIHVQNSNFWKTYTADIELSDGVLALYFTYRGSGNLSFKSFELCVK